MRGRFGPPTRDHDLPIAQTRQKPDGEALTANVSVIWLSGAINLKDTGPVVYVPKVR